MYFPMEIECVDTTNVFDVEKREFYIRKRTNYNGHTEWRVTYET